MAQTAFLKAILKFCTTNKVFKYHQNSNGKSAQITEEIVTRTTPCQPRARTCMLRLTEKYTILQERPTTLLNRRTELMEKCRQTNKFKLQIFRNTDTYCLSIPVHSGVLSLVINLHHVFHHLIPTVVYLLSFFDSETSRISW